MVGLVDAVVVVWVATVSPSHQPGLGLFPTGSAPPRVSKVMFRPPRGLYLPALGLSLAWECCLALDLGPPPGGPPVESLLALSAVEFDLDYSFMASHSVHLAWPSFCFSSPFWAVVAWGLS